MKTFRISFLVSLLFFAAQFFAQSDTVLTKAQVKEIKQLSADLRGKWWLLHKKCSGYPSQETKLKARVVSDTTRPDLRIEFQKKEIVIIHDYPFMKAANGKTGSWKIKCVKSPHSSIPDKYFLVLSEEIKSFLGISSAEGITFYWKNKHLILTDDKRCVFEFRAD